VTGNMPRRAIPFARSLSSRWACKAQYAFKGVYGRSNETDERLNQLIDREACELERRRQERISQLDKFIGMKADEFARLQHIQTFRVHLRSLDPLHNTDEFQKVVVATDSLIDRLKLALSAKGICDAAPSIKDYEDHCRGDCGNDEDYH
jgi:hypothetical protein